MHKLIEYICDELEDIEKKAEKEGKLSMTEVEYADKLAHLKKNLLKGEEMMEYSNAYGNNRSRARGRGANAKRDAMGRYSREYMQSYDGGEVADMLYAMMDDMPNDIKKDARRIAQRLESM